MHTATKHGPSMFGRQVFSGQTTNKPPRREAAFRESLAIGNLQVHRRHAKHFYFERHNRTCFAFRAKRARLQIHSQPLRTRESQCASPVRPQTQRHYPMCLFKRFHRWHFCGILRKSRAIHALVAHLVKRCTLCGWLR